MADFTIGEGDRLPEINATLKVDGVAIDLTSATVKFIMADTDGTLKVDAAATVVSAAAGTVKYAWIAADTDTPGEYTAEWEITFSDTRKETVPNGPKLTVQITPQLG